MAMSAFFMCFALLLKSGCSQTKPTAMVSSHFNAKPTKFADVSTCEWNCVISSKDFSKEMKKLIKEKKLIILDVKYDEKVDERCLDQNDTKTLNKPDSWIWLTAASNSEAKQSSGYSSSTSAPKPFEDNILLEKSQEGYKEVNVWCDFEPATRDARDNAPGSFDNQFIAMLLIQGIANSAGDLHNLGSLCYAETKHNPYICINISQTGKNSETELDFGIKMLYFAINFTGYLIPIVIALYAPAIICLFPVTEVTDRQGVRQIILEGPSPVGLRSLVAKFFHPEKETIWRKMIKCMLVLAVVPALDKIPPIGPPLVSQPPSFLICLYVCYGIRAFCLIFCRLKSSKVIHCLSCKFVRKEDCFYQGELLKVIISHLGVQTLLFANCWKLFTRSLLRYVHIVSLVFPVLEVSLLTRLQGLLFIIFVVTIPLVTIILILTSVIVFIFFVIYTTPTFSVDCYSLHFTLAFSKTDSFCIAVARVFLFLIEKCVILLAGMGASFILWGAAFNVGQQSLVATIVFVKHSTDSLPYVACFVIVVYYLWSCYSSLTSKYRDLTLKLFKLHKTSFNELQQRQDLESKIEPANYNVDITRRFVSVNWVACDVCF